MDLLCMQASCPLLGFQGRQIALLLIDLLGVLPVFSEGASLRALVAGLQ